MSPAQKEGFNVKLGFVIIALAWVSNAMAAEESVFIELTPEELAAYQFDQSETPFAVSALNLGQRAILERQRRQIKDLMQRYFGSDRLRGDDTDLVRFQQLVDQGRIRRDDVSTWQALGIAFGDLLIARHGLEWVIYEDEYGVSKALRWQKTDNIIFPVTLFSKRVQFNEAIDVAQIYTRLSNTITEFKTSRGPLKLP